MGDCFLWEFSFSEIVRIFDTFVCVELRLCINFDLNVHIVQRFGRYFSSNSSGHPDGSKKIPFYVFSADLAIF
jgi:hypothetical protein